MASKPDRSFLGNFRHFFLRGLGILLPSVLTIWILVAAYNFVNQNIGGPINAGIREVILQTTDEFTVTPEELEKHKLNMTPEDRAAWEAKDKSNDWLSKKLRRRNLENWWKQYAFPLNLIGLFVAILAIYIVGALLGSFIGRRLYTRGEQFVNKIPLIRYVYPSVKQVTDFFFGDGRDRMQFNRVVAVEYPRRGIWSVGLVTGDTMRDIQDKMGKSCMTIFVPSSPTPFTGYVITVPKEDTIDLDIAIDDALRFAISGGVIVPMSQRINPPSPEELALENSLTAIETSSQVGFEDVEAVKTANSPPVADDDAPDEPADPSTQSKPPA